MSEDNVKWGYHLITAGVLGALSIIAKIVSEVVKACVVRMK